MGEKILYKVSKSYTSKSYNGAIYQYGLNTITFFVYFAVVCSKNSELHILHLNVVF